MIQALQPNLAGKITGILLEIDSWELLYMLKAAEEIFELFERTIAEQSI